jgi:tRNA pseudouridine38-40 synthase
VPTFKLTLEYDGTAYAGWQRQPDQPTVQAALENAFHHITQTHTPVIGAGRTDSGVHALGQVASFRSDRPMTANEWTRALNALLPADISAR